MSAQTERAGAKAQSVKPGYFVPTGTLSQCQARPNLKMEETQTMEEDTMGGTEVTYQVTGEKIAARLTERAEAAEQIAEDLLGPDGSEPDGPCEKGIVEAAREDAKRLRLRAEHIDKAATFTVGAHTLQEIFLTADHYGMNLGGIGQGPAATEMAAEARW